MSEEVDNSPATEVVQYDLGFDNILNSMGMGEIVADLDDGFDYDEEEEESKSQTTTSTRKWSKQNLNNLSNRFI